MRHPAARSRPEMPFPEFAPMMKAPLLALALLFTATLAATPLAAQTPEPARARGVFFRRVKQQLTVAKSVLLFRDEHNRRLDAIEPRDPAPQGRGRYRPR